VKPDTESRDRLHGSDARTHATPGTFARTAVSAAQLRTLGMRSDKQYRAMSAAIGLRAEWPKRTLAAFGFSAAIPTQ